MAQSAAIVLAGGRSSRMGAPKAALDWHGSTLLRRVTGIAARAVDGPVVVVGAPGQELPALGEGVEVARDAREGRGPFQGLATGLAAIGGRASVVFACPTDAPLLHPAFVRRVIAELGPGDDVAVPDLDGRLQPLAAAYRAGLRDTVAELVDAGLLGSAPLLERCRVRRLTREALLGDASLARLDPGLDSVRNLNDRADYERALALPAPEIAVARAGAPGGVVVRAWSLGAAAAAAGAAPGHRVRLNGAGVAADPDLPLAAGDALVFGAERA